jgi:hypothetical protein
MTTELLSGPVKVPGYYDFTAEQYHADPAPRPSGSSGTLATLIVDTPRAAKETHPRLRTVGTPEQEEEREKKQRDKKFDLGSIAHTLLLGKGREIVVIDAADWKTKAAKEQRDEAFANGLQPCLAKTFEKAQMMVEAARLQLGDDKENSDAFTNGRAEIPLFWQEQTKPGKMWMRAMLDWQMDDRRRIYDYKTFARGADPDQFNRWLAGAGKDIQDPFYSRGVAALEGCDWQDVDFRFVVQDTEFPYLLCTVRLVPEEQEAQGGRLWSYERSQWAIDKWAACAAAGLYRGFIPRTHHVAAPAWAQTQWDLRRRADEAGEQMMQEQGEKAVLL